MLDGRHHRTVTVSDMCGIAGFLASSQFDPRHYRDVLVRMADTLQHRGPDSEGFWHDESAGIGLAHRRLSIIDLSAAGHQPMVSASGRYVITYNGEIYNTAELRAYIDEREPHAWRGHSDTEVLLECIESFGLHAALDRVDGMFAFALWDQKSRQLSLARDPFGEKPLYYGIAAGSLVFASELLPMRRFPGFDASLDQSALQAYLRYGYVPSPRSIYAAVRKLPPGSVISFQAAGDFDRASAQRFWDPAEEAQKAKDEGRPDQSLETVLRDSVRRRMASDVPLGCLLSGGVDSSLIAALMQGESASPIRTFHLSTGERGYDESAHARTVARAIGSDHHELHADARHCLSAAQKMSAVYGEPFADSSQIATFLVSEFAASKVRVALSGDGGDELFGGYNRHAKAVWPSISRIPLPLRKAAAAAADAVGAANWDAWVARAPFLFPRELRAGRAGSKLQKFAIVMSARDERDYHQRLLSQTQNPEAFVLGPPRSHELPSARAAGFSFPERAMLHDTAHYLPDDILVKTDRASMAHSLELRSPFLSRDVFRHAWAAPFHDKVAGGVGKLPLRKLLARFLPNDVIDRPKQGFAIPIGAWLRGELRDWSEDLLSESRLVRDGVLEPKAVRSLWARHLTERADLSTEVWTLIVLQSWLSEGAVNEGRDRLTLSGTT